MFDKIILLMSDILYPYKLCKNMDSDYVFYAIKYFFVK